MRGEIRVLPGAPRLRFLERGYVLTGSDTCQRRFETARRTPGSPCWRRRHCSDGRVERSARTFMDEISRRAVSTSLSSTGVKDSPRRLDHSGAVPAARRTPLGPMILERVLINPI